MTDVTATVAGARVCWTMLGRENHWRSTINFRTDGVLLTSFWSMQISNAAVSPMSPTESIVKEGRKD